MDAAELQRLCDSAIDGDRRSVARLVSLFEDTRATACGPRGDVLARLGADPRARSAVFLGVTGTPGAGKSTLVGEVATRLVAADPVIRVAVLAVDPASHLSGGALLGDRTRVRFAATEGRLYFRSQSSAGALGGIGRSTFHVCRLLERLFDYVFVETVGIGQSEVEVRDLVERVYLVLQPMAGDQVQFMKAGIMEIPDVIVLNKSDQEAAARRSLAALRSSLSFARPMAEDSVPILSTSAVTGAGLDALVDDVVAHRSGSTRRSISAVEPAFFRRHVERELGAIGLRYVRESGFAPTADLSYDRSEAELFERFRAWLCTDAAPNPAPCSQE